ncbi:MAG: hypothetical protein JG762_197 [Deferribacteraceae bacterium]|jgi:hypothetical protein|nr:hypothetical protein [Deferribacteraceae bacterium]
MSINFDNTINIRDKLTGNVSKKKSSANDNSAKTANNVNLNIESKKFADIVEIKRENRLAANSYSLLKSEDDANEVLNKLKDAFQKQDASSLINAHGKVDPDKVLKFYPFE